MIEWKTNRDGAFIGPVTIKLGGRLYRGISAGIIFWIPSENLSLAGDDIQWIPEHVTRVRVRRKKVARNESV